MEEAWRRIRNSHARSREDGVPPAAETAVRVDRSRQGHRGYSRTPAPAGQLPCWQGKEADKAQKFIWGVLSEMCLYSARRVPEISDSIVDVDHAMCWGFGWDLGPFEIWDAIRRGSDIQAEADSKRSKSRCRRWSRSFFLQGRKVFYQSERGDTLYFDIVGNVFEARAAARGVIILKSRLRIRRGNREKFRRQPDRPGRRRGLAASSTRKSNAIGGDLIAMLHKGLARLRDRLRCHGGSANFQAVNFSAGANLMLVLMTAQEQEWDDLHLAVRQFQNVNLALKSTRRSRSWLRHRGWRSAAAAKSHAATVTRIHAAAEAYMGLVETGVGLIPAGGGTKEMLIRANERAEGEEDLDLFHALKPVFENVSMAKVSTSGEEARELGYLRRADLVAMNLDRLVGDAKQTALGLVRAEWRQTAPASSEPSIRVLGEEFSAAGEAGDSHDATLANSSPSTMRWSRASWRT